MTGVRCAHCDTELPEHAAFCFACGAQITPRVGSRMEVAAAHAETAPFEPSPLRTPPAEPEPAPPSSPTAGPEERPPAAAPGEEAARRALPVREAAPSSPAAESRWAMAASEEWAGSDGVAPTGSPWALEGAGSSASLDSSGFDLELRLARRRRWIHALLILLSLAFVAGAIFFIFDGVRALRSAAASEDSPLGDAPVTGKGLVEVSGPGRVDRGAVSEAIRRVLLPALRPCFDRGADTLVLDLASDGALKTLLVDGRPPAGDRQQACVRAALESWRTPVPRGGPVTLRIPLRAP